LTHRATVCHVTAIFNVAVACSASCHSMWPDCNV